MTFTPDSSFAMPLTVASKLVFSLSSLLTNIMEGSPPAKSQYFFNWSPDSALPTAPATSTTPSAAFTAFSASYRKFKNPGVSMRLTRWLLVSKKVMWELMDILRCFSSGS